MSITAPLQPEVPSGDASRAVIEGLVDGLTGLAVADARRFVAEARMLVQLRVAAEAVDASMGWPVWVAEAALAQGVSEGSLRYRAERAAELLAHPALCTALDEALVGVPHALRLLETVAEAPPPIAVLAVAEALAAARGRTLSPVELAAVARRAWYRLDADAVARQRQAGLADRGLWFAHLTGPGISQFGGTAAVEQALAAQQRLHSAAKTPTDPDDVRTCAQREADLARALLTHGSLPDRALPEAQVQLTVHIPAATLTGESDEPGVLTGAGLIDAHHVRGAGRLRRPGPGRHRPGHRRGVGPARDPHRHPAHRCRRSGRPHAGAARRGSPAAGRAVPPPGGVRGRGAHGRVAVPALGGAEPVHPIEVHRLRRADLHHLGHRHRASRRVARRPDRRGSADPGRAPLAPAQASRLQLHPEPGRLDHLDDPARSQLHLRPTVHPAGAARAAPRPGRTTTGSTAVGAPRTATGRPTPQPRRTHAPLDPRRR